VFLLGFILPGTLCFLDLVDYFLSVYFYYVFLESCQFHICVNPSTHSFCGSNLRPFVPAGSNSDILLYVLWAFFSLRLNPFNLVSCQKILWVLDWRWILPESINPCFFFFVFNPFLFLYWRIIALQNFVVFCQISTWISHRCVCVYVCVCIYIFISPSLWTSLPVFKPCFSEMFKVVKLKAAVFLCLLNCEIRTS